MVEEYEFFTIGYALDSDEPSGGFYYAPYQQTWDEDFNDLVDMQLVYGETVMQLLGELCSVLGRSISTDEWELGYDEREEKTN